MVDSRQPEPADRIPLERVLDGLPDRTVVVGSDLRILAAGRGYRDAFASGEEVAGRFCYEVSHGYSAPCDEAGESCPISQCRATGEASHVLHVHHTSAGARHEEVTVHPVRDAGGAVVSFIEVLRPVALAASKPGETEFVGRAPAFNRMLQLASRVAPTDTPVLLLGESGTGKERLAQAIHAMSARAAGRFVPLDCSGVAESLFESELFGFEKGAFTGATQKKPGLVETCDGGTLFLDEVGDISLPLQVKLLRLIETRAFRRVGSNELRRSDFRLLCATHRDLAGMVEAGSFRRDLYHRIAAFPIRLPPLRERREDLPLLVETIAQRFGCPTLSRFHPDALAALAAYAFPGNVRELQNVLQRACLLAGGGTVLAEHLSDEVIASSASGIAQARPGELVTLEEAERRYLRWVLATFRGDRRELALRLGITERTLYRKIADLD
ncbi:MAG: sigma-54-dependent Fis family transcriptional regulator [Vicinamibacteria bacterium]